MIAHPSYWSFHLEKSAKMCLGGSEEIPISITPKMNIKISITRTNSTQLIIQQKLSSTSPFRIFQNLGPHVLEVRQIQIIFILEEGATKCKLEDHIEKDYPDRFLQRLVACKNVISNCLVFLWRLATASILTLIKLVDLILIIIDQ